MLVREWMTREVVTVTPETPVEQIIQLLAGKSLSGLPVVDGCRLVGIITEGDLIMREKPVHTPAAIAFLGSILFVENPARTFEELRRHVGSSAKDIMSGKLVTIGPDATLEKAAALMVERDVKRLPVVEGDKLVGILTHKDMVRALLPSELR